MKGCDKDSNMENPFRPPSLVWKTKLADTGLLRDVVEADIQYDAGILFPGINNQTRSLYFLNSESGAIEWKWNDYFLEDNFWIARYPYQYESKVLIPEGRNLYCINLEDGRTVWKRRIEEHTGGTVTKGIGNHYFMLVDFYPNGDGSFEGRIFRGNVEDELLSLYITPNYSREVVQPQNGLTGSLDGFTPVKIGGKDYLVIFFGDPNEALYDIDAYVGMYNLTDNNWVYAKKPSVARAKSRCGESPIIKNNKIFEFCGFTLVCHDLMTGDLCWSKTVQDQGFSVMGWVSEKIVINSQDNKTRCINPDNGETIWELQTSGNPSIIRELNGLAYFIGGNGRLYGIDVSSGKIIWDFTSPDINDNPPAYFMQGIRIVKSSDDKIDKVLVASEKNAFCYNAAR